MSSAVGPPQSCCYGWRFPLCSSGRWFPSITFEAARLWPRSFLRRLTSPVRARARKKLFLGARPLSVARAGGQFRQESSVSTAWQRPQTQGAPCRPALRELTKRRRCSPMYPTLGRPDGPHSPTPCRPIRSLVRQQLESNPRCVSCLGFFFVAAFRQRTIFYLAWAIRAGTMPRGHCVPFAR